MKVAIVLITRWTRASIDQDGYAGALRQLGHSPVLVCLGNDAGPAEFPVVESTLVEMRHPAFWRSQGIDTAIIFDWLHEPLIVSAMHAAGINVICRVDGDGQCSVRVFPAAAWLVTVDPARGLVSKLRHIKHWVHRFLFLYLREDAEVLSTARAASAIAIESPTAAANLTAVFKHYSAQALANKIRIAPHSVQDVFINAPLNTAPRAPRIFCGGRWSDSQKDAGLLLHVIKRLTRDCPEVKITIAGNGSTEAFAAVSCHPNIEVLGSIARPRLIEILSECRFLLSSSRWESQPIGTLEAFCLGATVVAPPLPGFIDLAAGGRFGTLATHRSAGALVAAAKEELKKWDAGVRHPEEISHFWRPQVSNEAVIRALLASA